MKNKLKRQTKMMELIKSRSIETQDELIALLNMAGFDVTQATVSRDIRELKITKVITDGGKLKYAPMEMQKELSGRVLRVFRDGVINIDYAQNLIIIKTMSGMAMAVAACLDSLSGFGMIGTEIMGTIAGDDCIFCAVKSEENAVVAIGKMRDLLK